MGKIIDLEQDSPAWHAFRAKRIGASDVPAIMGKSPYSTPYQCWLKKTGRVPQTISTDAMLRGKRLEPIARTLLEEERGLSFPAVVMQHETKDYFHASLDGFNKEHNLLLEIKAPSRDEHLSSVVPEKYLYQVQAQLLISGANYALYGTIVEAKQWAEGLESRHETNTLTVLPNLKIFKEIEDAVDRFWYCLQNDIPPPIQEDEFELRQDTAWEIAADDFRAASNHLEQAEVARALSKERLIRLMHGNKNRGFGVSAHRQTRGGRIDWHKIPEKELSHLDLDKYRNEETEIVTVRLEKKNETFNKRR